MQEAVIAKPTDYVPGLDELADEIGAKPARDDWDVTLRARSGRSYSLVGLMTAFTEYLLKAETRIADYLDEFHELAEPGDSDEDDEESLF